MGQSTPLERSPTEPDQNEARPLTDIYVELAGALARRGRHADAVTALEQALDEAHGVAGGDILVALSSELVKAEKADEAFAVALDALDVVPQRGPDLLPLLERYMTPAALSSVAERLARTNWTKVVEDSSLNYEARISITLLLSRAFLCLDQPKRALNILLASRALSGDDARLIGQIGEARLLMDDTRGALTALRDAEAAAKRDGRFELLEVLNLRLALLHEQLGELDEAMARVPKELPSDPDVVGELLALRARCQLRLGDTQSASETAAKARGLAPRSLPAIRAHVAAFLATHKYRDAVSVADVGLELAPEDDGVSFSRIQALVEMQDDILGAEMLLGRLIRRLGSDAALDQARIASALRSERDGNLHYFLAVLYHTLSQHEESLREVDLALEQELTADFSSPDMPARRLRGLLLESARPTEAAAEYAAAGEGAYSRSQYILAIEMLLSARRLRVDDPKLGWLLADALLVASYSDEHAFGVDRERVKQGIEVWEETKNRGLPDDDYSWAYITRARLNLQLILLNRNQRHLLWETLTYCERFLVLNVETSMAASTFAMAGRHLGLWANAAKVLETARRLESGDTDTWFELCTALFNAGNLEKVEGVLNDPPDSHEISTSNVLREKARFRLLQGHNDLALQALEQLADEATGYSLRLWAKYHWLEGDHEAFEQDLERLLEEGPTDSSNRPFVAWATLYRGDAQHAAGLFGELNDEDSWLGNVPAEIALCRLASGDIAAGEAGVHQFLSATRSFEDLTDMIALDLPVVLWRYGDGTDASNLRDAVTRLAELARRRRDEQRWPSDAEDELEAVLAANEAVEESGGWSSIAARAGLARLAIEQLDWSAAIAHYRLLADTTKRFPEVERGLAWVADRLPTDTVDNEQREKVMSAVHELDSALADMRSQAPARLGQAVAESRLGDVLRQLGELPAARENLERALEIAERVRGPEHLDVAAIRSQLGDVLQELGDLAGARAQYERALGITEAALGSEHPEVGVVLYSLAGVLRALGELPAARENLERALEIDEAAFGPEHPEVATDLTALAGVLRALGELPAARENLERALEIAERVRGPEHLDVAAIRSRLGDVLQELGDLAGARENLERALEITERVRGPERPDGVPN
jgi:tetratricopeptide (TPR) repeat protein